MESCFSSLPSCCFPWHPSSTASGEAALSFMLRSAGRLEVLLFQTRTSFSQNMASLSLSPHPPKSSSSASQLHPMSSFSQLLKCHKYSLSRDMPGTARGECNYTSFPLSSSKLAFPNEFKQMLPDANLHLLFLLEPCSGSSCSSLRLACGYQSALA